MKNLIIYYSRRGQNYVNGSIKNLARGNAEVKEVLAIAGTDTQNNPDSVKATVTEWLNGME